MLVYYYIISPISDRREYFVESQDKYMDMIHLLVHFLVSRVMIRYHIMIPLSSLSSLIVVPHKIFANIACMILAMIQSL
jgi:hypothetical protein